VAATFADSGMRGDRLEPFLPAQAARGDVGGDEQVVGIAVGACPDERCGPSPVREARVELLLGLRSWQGVEPDYAADDETLTFQVDG
jgi:hypothetical protein